MKFKFEDVTLVKVFDRSFDDKQGKHKDYFQVRLLDNEADVINCTVDSALVAGIKDLSFVHGSGVVKSYAVMVDGKEYNKFRLMSFVQE